MSVEERKKFEAAAARKARELRAQWLQEREEKLAEQLKANAELRKTWFRINQTRAK